MLSGRGLCNELITHPEESYRLWYVFVCDLENTSLVIEEEGQGKLGGLNFNITYIMNWKDIPPDRDQWWTPTITVIKLLVL